jgi:hypothetical protein
MDEFTTVFVFSENISTVVHGNNGNITIGIIALIIGLAGLLLINILPIVFTNKANQIKNYLYLNKKRLMFGFSGAVAWATIWLGIFMSDNSNTNNAYSQLQEKYNSGEYQIAEGVVHVLHTQPEDGHDDGDIITIGDETFEINAYLYTLGYNTTISHGGVLTEGTYARVFYEHNETYTSKSHPNMILRIDIKD